MKILYYSYRIQEKYLSNTSFIFIVFNVTLKVILKVLKLSSYNYKSIRMSGAN